jgi:hypothetical protein
MRGGPPLWSEDDRGDKQPGVGDQHLESGAPPAFTTSASWNPVAPLLPHTR